MSGVAAAIVPSMRSTKRHHRIAFGFESGLELRCQRYVVINQDASGTYNQAVRQGYNRQCEDD